LLCSGIFFNIKTNSGSINIFEIDNEYGSLVGDIFTSDGQFKSTLETQFVFPSAAARRLDATDDHGRHRFLRGNATIYWSERTKANA
jgi:hypothetical protein